MNRFLLPDESEALEVLEDGARLEQQSASEHRAEGSQDEQHKQEDDERGEEMVDAGRPES